MTQQTCFTRKKTSSHWLSVLLLLSSLLLTGFVAAVQAKDSSGITPRIIGGVDASPTAYPWATALLTRSDNNAYSALFCGGTLIASEWVLTAAHCVSDIVSANDIDVAIGFADLNDADLVRTAVSAIYVHPHYDILSLNNDLALLKLASPSSNNLLTLADNTLTDTVYTNNDLMSIIGWGNTSKTALIFPSLLQETEIPPFDFAACNGIYNNSLTGNMICAAGSVLGDRDTCQGDSGGPMLYLNPADGQWYQTGITSFGEGCAQADIPGIYTRIANYLDWINGTQTFDAAFPDGYSFSFQGVGRTTTQTITLSNNSGAAITVNNVSLAGNTNFTIVGQTCTSGSIANNGNCSIELQYTAPGTSTQQDILTIELDTGMSFSGPVSGTGLASINATALDETPARTWYSGGDASWFTDSIANSIGGTAMRSGMIGDSQKSVLISYVTGPTTLNFRWKASTEVDFDYFTFYVDGVLVDAISGDQDWLQNTINITDGEHVVRWVYEKDYSLNELQDTVWLDNINTTSTGGGNTGGNGAGGFGGGGGGAMNALLLLLLMLMAVTRLVSQSVSRMLLAVQKKRSPQHGIHVSCLAHSITKI